MNEIEDPYMQSADAYERSRRICRENIARLKAQKAAPKRPIEGVRLEGHLHMLKPAPLSVSLLDTTK